MIIDRHLVRQIAMPFLLVSVVLLIIFVGFSLSKFLTQADAGLLNTGEVVRLTLLKVLISLDVLLPISLFFGLMLGLGSLHNDSEIVAMQASGISESHIIRPVVTLAIPLALATAVLAFYIRPWAYTQSYQIRAIAAASSDIDRIKGGQFYLTRHTDPEGEYKERAIFIEKISSDQALKNIFIRTRVGDELQVISSHTGTFVERPESTYHMLQLDNARIFKHVEDGPDLFARIDHFTMKVANKQPEAPRRKTKAISFAELRLSDIPKERSEYQWRISIPITTLLLALLTVPLSRSKPRHGRYAKLLLAFAIYAAYYNLIEVSQTWVIQQKTTSIWWTPALLALVVALLYVPWRSLKLALAIRKND